MRRQGQPRKEIYGGNAALQEAYRQGYRRFYLGLAADYSLSNMRGVDIAPCGLADSRATRLHCGGTAEVTINGFSDAVTYVYSRSVVTLRAWSHGTVMARGHARVINSCYGVVMLYENASAEVSEHATVYVHNPACRVIMRDARPCYVKEVWRQDGYDWKKPLQWVM